MQDMSVPATLAGIDGCGFPFKMMDTSFFLSRQTPLASGARGMSVWREKLFAWMMRNAESPMEFFGLPPNRVVEMGAQVKI
jgi:KUP system potassium uptake protein